ncbi:hypothetical protein [Ectopseudomonas oleovorans]|uniref:Uncharacterized protein n=1 Tax=Ectopseudomonas oleovorans TaxID=301 RepID=A0AA42TXE6_ECTOL|nr:hypothetical protein [Pseudomonas oleovorans]MDH1338239.1 hypothetical protein [Pseudomonas oleovorans]MDH1494131.1 hypothetical protein [Pseudomonas oleovorans]WGG20163.1 hypothetical protein N5O83_17265 [Pseudomonas oleovorans]
MPGALIRLVQGSLLLPSAALFIGLLTYHLQHGGLGLAWPLPPEPDGHIAIELALACLPAFALFLLAAASGMLKRRLVVLAVFGLCAAIAAYSAVNLLASAYGNTWTAGEILRGLFLAQLPQLGLASGPCLALTALLERLNHPRP